MKTRLPTQVPTAGEAYILPLPFRQFSDVYPFTCLSVHHPGSHSSSSPAYTDVSNSLVPTIDSHTDEGMRPTTTTCLHTHTSVRGTHTTSVRGTHAHNIHMSDQSNNADKSAPPPAQPSEGDVSITVGNTVVKVVRAGVGRSK